MRLSAALLLVAGLVFCSAVAGATTAPNVKGMFVRSPQTAGCFQGEPCDPPPQATFLVFSRNGVSTRVRIGATGAFSVHLAAGLYTVSVLPSHDGVSPAALRVPRLGVIHPRLVQRTG